MHFCPCGSIRNWKIMPRPTKKLATPEEKREEEILLKASMHGSMKYQNSQKQFVERLIPIDASIVHRRIVKIDGKNIPYDFVDCNLVKVEI